MKTTTTIFEILQSEYVANGFDEFYNAETNQLIEYGGKDAFINKIYQNDKDVNKLANRYIFGEYNLQSPGCDASFKRMFMLRFLNREIAFQTVDMFRNKLIGLLVANDQYLSLTYDHFEDMFASGNSSDNTQTSQSQYDDRNADVDLPQNNTELSLDDAVVKYASTTHYDRNRNKTSGENKTSQVGYNANVLQLLNNVYTNKLDEFDQKLFLQIW